MRIIKLVFIVMLLALATNAQTPLTPQFPTGVPNQTSMGNIDDNGRSLLTANIDRNTTSIPIAVDNFTVVPFIAVIDQEKLLCTGKSGLVLTCSRGYDGSTSTAHLNNAVIINAVASKYIKILQQETAAFATKLGTGASIPLAGSVLISNAPGQSTWLTGPDNTCLQKQGGVFVLATCAAPSFNQTIKAAGSAVTQRPAFNFSSSFSVTDNSGAARTDIDIANAGINLTTKVTGLLLDGNIASASAWSAKQPAGDYTTANAPKATVVGSTGQILNNPRDVVVIENVAYVANFGAGTFHIFDVSDKTHPVLLASTSDGLTGPRSLTVQGPYAYIADQTASNIVIFNISNPKNPTRVATINGGNLSQPAGAYAEGRYLYVSCLNFKWIIYDLLNPIAPVELGNYVAYNGGKPAKAYIKGPYAYLAVQGTNPNWVNDGLYIININNPASPATVGRYIVGPGFAPVQVECQDRYCYLLNESGTLDDIDVIDLAHPALVGTIETGALGYGGSGLQVAGKYAYVTTFGGIFEVYDISNPTKPVLVKSTTSTLNVPARVFVRGGYAYVVNRGLDPLLPPGGSISIIDIGQSFLTAIEAGSGRFSRLSIDSDLDVGKATIWGSLNVGGASLFNNNVAVKGDVSATTFNGSALGTAAFANSSSFQPAGNYITGLTGDVSASGLGSVATTLATVNSTPGSFGSASKSVSATVNGKGLITSLSVQNIQITESQVTSLTSDLAGKQATGNYITALTGDVSVSGPGNAEATIGTGRVTNSMLAGSIDLTSKVTGVLPIANGGTGITVTRVTSQFDKITDTSLANVTELSVNVSSGKTYSFEAVLFVTLDSTGLGKIAIGGTATATAISFNGYCLRNAQAGILGLGLITSMGTATTALSVNTIKTVIVRGEITVDAEGTLTVQFAESASSGTSSVLVGSVFTVKDSGS